MLLSLSERVGRLTDSQPTEPTALLRDRQAF